MEFKKEMLNEELGLPKTGKKNFTPDKSQKVIVSEEQLERLLSKLTEAHCGTMEEDMETMEGDKEMDEAHCGGTHTEEETMEGEQEMDENAFVLAADEARDKGEKEFEFPKGSGKMHPVTIKADIDVKEEEDMDETYDSMDHEDRDEFDGRKSKVIGVYSNIDDQRMGMSETTIPITESEVKDISKFMNRMNSTGKYYNPAPKMTKTNNEKLEGLFEDVNTTYRLIRNAIIKERIGSIEIKDYQEILSEGSFYGSGDNRHHPGESAAAGLENIVNNIKRAYSYVKDSRTRKQIMNTLTKLNNFMTYSAELIASGRDQRAARSFGDVTNPLPYPEVDEPEELEDVDDEIDMMN
tara:strand:+ start:76 stop:1131 length:1056 start_codon:yes stop_codon:yes gene_type:complete